ncbi:MAG: hypothetical protein Q8O51_03025 [bacterium]|nr:hypothetical protein [bacterium]
MDNEKREGLDDEVVTPAVEENPEHKETPNEVLKTEMEDEFEVQAEPTAEDLQVEEEMKLTGSEEKWLQDLKLRVKEWKASRSTYPHGAQDAIGKIHAEDFDGVDVRLYHVFQQLQKSPSPYFKQRFGRLLRKQVRDTQNDTESTGYQLTKILDALSSAEQE